MRAGREGRPLSAGKGYIRGRERGGAWRMRALLRWHTGLDGRGDCCQRGRVYKRGEREGELGG